MSVDCWRQSFGFARRGFGFGFGFGFRVGVSYQTEENLAKVPHDLALLERFRDFR
jgi:hypothetical protein